MASERGQRGGGEGGAIRPGQLSALLQEIAAAPTPSEGGWGTALQPGAVIGKFQLIREVGSGGFGVVWEARDRELGRSVAFKAVRAGGRAGLREERLLREAEAAARLSHPNIVTLHDLGRAEAGPYLVLELLQGQTLEERLHEGKLPVAESVRIACEVAKGVAHAHGQGVVHRDLKPANVFLCDDGQVKVLDFGLAHAFGQRRQDGGTPAYMAPEQWEGAPEDERTDVFALGVMLYRMLTGELPFGDAEGKEHLSKEPAPALEIAEQPGLAELVGRMLEKKPTQRPRDGAEVAAALRTLRQQLEGSPTSGPSAVRTRRRPGLRLAGLALGGLVAGALLAGGVMWWRYRGGPQPMPGADGRIVVAVADVVNETGEKELDVLSGLLVTSLEQSRRLSVMTQERILDLAAKAGRPGLTRVTETVGREVARAQGAKVLLMPAIRKLGPTYSLEMRAVDPATDGSRFTLADRASSKEALLDLLDRLSERTRTELGEGRGDIERAHVELGTSVTRSLEAYQRYVEGRELWLRDGQPAFALGRLEEALRLDPRFAPAHAHLAGLLEDYGRPDLAAPHWRAAQEQNEQLPEKERRMLQLALGLRTPGAAPRSEEAARRIAEEAVARFPSDKDVLLEAADVFMSLGLADRRDAALRSAVDLDPGHWATAWRLSRRLGAKTEVALSVARHAVAARRSAANVALLAEALHAAGATSEAAAAAREALAAPRGRTSLVAERACFVLHQTGVDGECRTVWEQMKSDGANALERDAAASEIVVSLLVRGRSREGLRALRATEEHRRGEPGRNAYAITIGHDRRSAPPDALAEVRRIPAGLLQRNFLAWIGRAEEAERADAELGERWAWGHQAQWIYEAIRAADQGHFGEAARLMRSAYDAVLAANASTYPWSRAAFLVEALVADGRLEEALAVAPPSLPCRCRDPVDYGASYPPFAIARARAMEQLGRRADAMRELDGIVAFWKEADADLPLLVEAKALRARLAKAPAPRKGAAAPPATQPSIAVLPFADLSPGKDQEYFADGVAEEILNALTQVNGLKVVGRTSSFSFKGKGEDLRSIGRKLGVTHVLEGSVRRDGLRLRIAAKLVTVLDGRSLWAESYDRDVGDVFAVQEGIARAAVDALQVRLLPGRENVSVPFRTTPEAYRQHLLGRQLLEQLGEGSGKRAEQAFRRALAIDPGYAPAWAGLASALYWRAQAGGADLAHLLRQGGDAADRAVALAPGRAEGYAARAGLRLAAWDWEGARSDAERAVALDPGSAIARRRRALVRRIVSGDASRGFEDLELAVVLDPLSAAGWHQVGLRRQILGDDDRAREAFRKALEITPSLGGAKAGLAVLELRRGRVSQARNLLTREDGGLDPFWRAAIEQVAGNDAGAREALAELTRVRGQGDPIPVAEIHALRGEGDLAFERLQLALARRDPRLRYLRDSWFLEALHPDPRWKELLEKMNLPVD